jgi:two-component system, cell cycle sensor histidine kinase and response regulator CckA
MVLLQTSTPPDGVSLTLPDPTDWLANTLRRRLALVGSLALITTVFALLGVRIPVVVFGLFGVHFVTVLIAREWVARQHDDEARRRAFAMFLSAECWIIAGITHLVGGTRWLGVGGLLLQVLLPTFSLRRREAFQVLGHAVAAWVTLVTLETAGVLVPPAFPNLPSARAEHWVVGTATLAVGAIFLVFGVVSVRAFRRIIEDASRQHAQREAAFRATLAALRDVIFQTDADGRWAFLSPAWEVLTGQQVDAAIGRRADAAFHPDDQPAVRRALAVRTEGATARAMLEARLRGPDGTWRTVEVRPQVEEPGDDASRYVSGTIADVTERAALRDQEDQTARLEAIGRLAGGVAHDVNNVLTTIQVQADALEQAVAPDVRSELRPIHEAVARGALLTRQLLSFGRRQQVTPTVLDVASVVRSLDAVLRRMAGGDLRVTVAADAPAWARVDPLQVEQILGCFVSNARDASVAGQELLIEVTGVDADAAVPVPTVGPIGARPRAVAGDAVPAGQWTVLRVRDAGLGVDADIMPRVFEPFVTTRVDDRTGLGLAAVYGAVQQAQGLVRLASSPGVGTTAEVFFPRVEAPAALPTTDSVPRVPDAGVGRRVLLVEDEGTLRLAVRRMLERRGYAVREAANGREALAVLEADGAPEFVVSDVVMPELDGRAFVQSATARWPALRVLFISGYTAADVGHAATTLDGHPLLQKPFTASALHAALDALASR